MWPKYQSKPLRALSQSSGIKGLELAVSGWVGGWGLVFKCPVNSTKEVRTDPSTTTTKREGTLNYSIQTDEHN